MKQLDKKVEKIISQYKKDMKTYIEEHNLDSELYNDIDERIKEKLESVENPTKEDALKILSEIGTPEEIFGDDEEIENKIHSSKWNFLQKLKRDHDGNKVVFLGVFKEIGDKMEINANYLRIAYLLLIFLSIIVGGNIVPIALLLYFIGFIFLRTGIVRFVFSGILGLICVAILVPAVVLLGAYLSDFHVGNIYPFMGVNYLLPIGLVVGIFSLILLIYVFFAYAFNKKFFWKIFIAGLITFVIAISLGIATVVNVSQRYIYQTNGEFTKEIQIDNQQNIELYNNQIHGNSIALLYGDLSVVNIYGYNIKVIDSPDNKVHFTFEERTYGNPDIQKQARKYIDNIDINISKDGEISFELKDLEGEKFPLFFTELEISEIAIPKGTELKVGKYTRFGLSPNEVEVIYPEELTGYEDFIIDSCDVSVYKDGKIICNIDESHLDSIIKDTKYRVLYTDLEKYIPLKFNSVAYTWDGPYNIRWIDDDTLAFEVGDGRAFFDIQATIALENSEPTVRDIKILNVEGQLNSDWYINPEILVTKDNDTNESISSDEVDIVEPINEENI